MGNLLAYSGTTTKIRAIRSRLLTTAHYRELASMSSVTEALSYLKKQPGYRELFANVDESSLHRSEVEKILTNAIYVDFRRIYRFAPVEQRKFLDLYFRRYEVSILKTCIRMVFDHRDVVLDLEIFQDFFQNHSDIDLKKISTSKTIEEFVMNLKGSIYFNALNRLEHISNPTLWDYETAIDLFYFKWFFQNSKVFPKKEQVHFKEAYGTKMDLLNVMWIYRSRHYFHMSTSQIYAHLISAHYRLKYEDIKALVEASSRDEFAAAVKQTYYGRHYENYSVNTLDETYNSIRYSIQRRAAIKNPYSLATVIAYLFEKEHEIYKLTIALECVRYGLPQGETLKYINSR